MESEEALDQYLRAGPSRSRALLARDLDLPRGLVEQWFTESGWAEKAAAWDRDQLRQRVEEARKEAENRHRLGQAARAVTARALANVDPAMPMNLFDLNQLGQLAAQLLDE